jgi:hypothetical protein
MLVSQLISTTGNSKEYYIRHITYTDETIFPWITKVIASKNTTASWLLLNLVILINTNIPLVYAHHSPTAAEYGYEWCVQTISAESKNGLYPETIISTLANTSVLKP